MKNLFLAVVLFFFCFQAHSKSWIPCKCGGCGSTDIYFEGATVDVHYDACGRGGYGSHPVATYSVSHPDADTTRLTLVRRYSAPSPDQVEWKGDLESLTCAIYSRSCADDR
jgi:hypothetical protein